MKKTLTLLLACALVMSLSAACGSSTAAPTTRPAASSDWTPGAGYAGKYDPSNVLTISWVTQGDRPVDPDSAITKAIEEMFNLKIDYVYLQRAEQAQLLNIKLAAGDIPDVWRPAGNAGYRELIPQGVLAEINMDLLQEVAPTFYAGALDLYAEFGNVFEFLKDDGKLYALPVYEINSSYMLMTVWRDDWLKNVGIDKIPETVEEAEAAFYKFVNDDPDQNGQNDTFAFSGHGINHFLYAYGGPGMNNVIRDGKVTRVVLEPEHKQGMAKIVQFYADGLIDPEFHTGENRGQNWPLSIPFFNGVIGYTAGHMFYHLNPPLAEGANGGAFYEGFLDLQPDGSWDFGKPLKGPWPEVISPRWGIVPGGNNMVYGVNMTEEKQVRLLQIIERQMTDWDVFLLLDSGIEGIHYSTSVNDKNQTIYSSLLNREDQYQPGNRTEGFTYVHGIARDFVIRQDISNYDFAEKYFTPKAMGAIPYTNPIFGTLEEEIRDISAALGTRYDEVRNLFITGQRAFNDTEWDAFITELKTLGIEKYLEAAQEWYDANK